MKNPLYDEAEVERWMIDLLSEGHNFRKILY